MLKLLLFACLLSLSMTQVGCTTSGHPIGEAVVSYDKFEQSHYEYVQVGGNLKLSAIRTAQSPKRSFALVVDNVSRDYSGMSEVIFLLDNAPMKLTGISSLDNVSASITSVLYHSTSVYPISASQVRRILDADVVETKKDLLNSFVWSQKWIDAVQKFYDLFVLENWDKLSEEQKIESKSSKWTPSSTGN